MCGLEKGTVEVTCPFGFCPDALVCESCYDEYQPHTAQFHEVAGCLVSAEHFREMKEKEQNILDSGEYLEVFAELGEFECFHVTFENREGERIEEYMHRDLYYSFPLDVPKSLTDFEKSFKDGPSES